MKKMQAPGQVIKADGIKQKTDMQIAYKTIETAVKLSLGNLTSDDVEKLSPYGLGSPESMYIICAWWYHHHTGHELIAGDRWIVEFMIVAQAARTANSDANIGKQGKANKGFMAAAALSAMIRNKTQVISQKQLDHAEYYGTVWLTTFYWCGLQTNRTKMLFEKFKNGDTLNIPVDCQTPAVLAWSKIAYK
jgi:hypothetical protein